MASHSADTSPFFEPRCILLDGGPDPHEKGHFYGHNVGISHRLVAAMRPFAKLIWTLVEFKQLSRTPFTLRTRVSNNPSTNAKEKPVTP